MNDLERRWRERERAQQEQPAEPLTSAAEAPAEAPAETPPTVAVAPAPPPARATEARAPDTARALQGYAAVEAAHPTETRASAKAPSAEPPVETLHPPQASTSLSQQTLLQQEVSRQGLSRQEKVRLLLAALVGALAASIVFLSIELVRRNNAPTKDGSPSAAASALVAVDPLTGQRVVPPASARPDPLAQMFQRMAQGMGQAFQGGGGTQGFTFSFGGDDAAIELEDDGEALIVVAKVKDAIADKLDVQVQGNTFTLRGQRRMGSMGAMSFQKSVSLPADVDAAKMTPTFKDGVLRVRLPKKR